MKNKFEALTTFQQWPEDWQRLCAEYWAENDKPSGSVTLNLHPMWEELHQRASKVAEECYPQAVAKVVENVSNQACKVLRRKPKAMSPKASRASRPFTKEEYDYARQKPSFVNDSHYAEHLAKKFGRTKKAFQNYLSLIRRNLIDPNTGMKLPTDSTNKKETN